MMPATYEPIATTTLSSDGNITFSSIPATYTDLRIIVVGTSSSSAARGKFNNDSGTNYDYQWLYTSSGNATAFGSTGNQYFQYGPVRASGTISQLIIDVFNYAGSTFKTVLWQLDNDQTASAGNITRAVGTWKSTSAINEINLIGSGTNGWSAPTTATIYGILKA